MGELEIGEVDVGEVIAEFSRGDGHPAFIVASAAFRNVRVYSVESCLFGS
jgi:hypothetical protein